MEREPQSAYSRLKAQALYHRGFASHRFRPLQMDRENQLYLYETIAIREARNKRVELPGRRASRCSF